MTDEQPEQQNVTTNASTPLTAADTSISEGATSLTPEISNISIFSNGGLSLLCQCVNFLDISFREKVGHGSYGTVYKAVWRDRYVAVKEFEPKAEQKAIETEVKQLSRVQHSNIIALFGIASHQMSTYLIMEYAEGGSLHDFLHGKVKPHYSTAHGMSWARQCAEGVAYLHAMKPKPLIHRDLKPLNLLLTNKGRHLKICDFGTVADKSTFMTNNKGSAAWMAPEVFEGSKYTEKCDIFSWGIVLWEVLSREKPFKDVDNTYSIMWKIHKGERPQPITNLPEPIENLMTSCWATKPDVRPSMLHVVEVMNELVKSFVGAEEPLEYEFVNQQIISPNANETTGDNYVSDFSNFSNSSLGTQVTRYSNNSSSKTPTPPAHLSTNPFLNNSNIPNVSYNSVRWDDIPEEPDSGRSTEDQLQAVDDDDDVKLFNLNTSEESKQRYETIRNSMLDRASQQMKPLNIHVDPNTWDFENNGNVGAASHIAKSDGKERVMVTEAKPIIKSSENLNSNLPIDSGKTDPDEDEDNGQSWHEMLDPELQPEQPIPDNAESQEIYREHRRLAKEYLRVETNLYYAKDFKEKFLIQMDPQERQEKQELLNKMKEKEELLELYNNIKQHWETMRSGGQPLDEPSRSEATGQNGELVPDDSWVVIGRNNQNS